MVGLSEVLTFVTVLDDTPAASAGVKAGDKLVAINEERVPSGPESRRWFSQKIQVLRAKNTPIVLTIERQGATLQLSTGAHYICNVALSYALADAVNAMASVTTLTVTSGMLRFTQDDHELASVLGHELAHAILRHPEQLVNAARERVATTTPAIIFGRSVVMPPPPRDPYGQDKERDADYLGIYLAAAAGFDTSRVADLWRRMAARNPAQIKESHIASHPSTPERFLRLQAAATEIATKQQTGQRLLPEMSQLKTSYDGDFVFYEGRKQVSRRVLKPSGEPGKDLPDFTQVPFVRDAGRVLYQRFLALRVRPRAFALNAGGMSSYRTGANASADALEACNARSKNRDCVLYVVNDDFVYNGKLPSNTAGNTNTQLPKAVPGSMLDRQLRAAHPPTGFAELADAGAIPYVTSNCRDIYRKWLAYKLPRAYAVNSATGNCGYSQGVRPPQPDLPTEPAQRALIACERLSGNACRLYAVDEMVVWKP